MAREMAISVNLMIKAIMAYGPKVLSYQQVTVGVGLGGLELSAVPTRRATRLFRGLRLRCQYRTLASFLLSVSKGNHVTFPGGSLLLRHSAGVLCVCGHSRVMPAQKAPESGLLLHSQLQCEWPMPTSARTAVLSLQSATIGAGPQPDQASWMTSRRYR